MRWNVLSKNKDIISGLLENRGIKDKKEFLDPHYPEFKLNLKPTLARIRLAIKKKEIINNHVLGLEKQGNIVHWPFRDTNQNDPIGLNICSENREAIYSADEIHIWFDPASQGSLFDIGMTLAFLRMMPKKVIIINLGQTQPTPHKSFQNVLLELTKLF